MKNALSKPGILIALFKVGKWFILHFSALILQ